jgi:hypothetical protein
MEGLPPSLLLMTLGAAALVSPSSLFDSTTQSREFKVFNALGQYPGPLGTAYGKV